MKTLTNTEKFNLFINGEILPSAGKKYFESINPSNGDVFARLADAGKEDIQTAISAARRTFDEGEWPRLTLAKRGIYLKKIAQLIRKHAKELADLECSDTGKTSKQTTFIDVPTCADTFEYFGGISKVLEPRLNAVAAPVKSTTQFEPLGVVACMIPWNYPLIMFAWKTAPALIAGNTVVFKPSGLGAVSILRLAQLIKESGLPDGVLNIVTTTDYEAASELVKSPQVDMISFTGGTETGQKIMQLASVTTKKVSLELGGKSPAIVFADCQFDSALGGVLSSIFMNQGQMCTACSRLLLEDKIYENFLTELVEKTKKLKIGPANDYATDFGPLISREHRDSVLNYIEKGKKEGARLVCGGRIPQDDDLVKGFYIEPSIFTETNPSMTIVREEIFGPVLSVMKFSNADQAIELANDSEYGLAASVWTKDLKKAEKVSRRLQSGTVWINTYGGFYNEASFGGYKQSGHGRELGAEGLLEYTQSKHVCIDETPGGSPLVSNWF